MKAFKAFWTCALENGTTSAENVWRGALEWVMRRGMHHYGNDFLTDTKSLSQEIRKELGEIGNE